MSSNWKSVALAVATLRLAASASDAMATALPEDPCALLEPAEIQVLAPNIKIGSGISDTSAAPLGAGCTYSWGPDSRAWGKSALTIIVTDAAKGWPGVSSDLIKQGMLMKAKAGGPNASLLPDVGDAAVFTFEERVSTAAAEAYLKAKGLHLALKFHAGDSLSNKDNVVALLKLAASRL